MAFDPTPAIARWRIASKPTSGSIACVYRSRNAGVVRALVGEATAAGLLPRLWALDEVAPELAPYTVGSGAGSRSALLNRMYHREDTRGRWVVLADDDIEFRRGTLVGLLSIGEALGLDVLQPAHDGASFASHDVVRSNPASIVRRTSFVEIGPLVAVVDDAASLLLPFADGLGMGWGEDYRWARTIESNGLVAGIVDAVRIRHLNRTGSEYDLSPEMERAAAVLKEVGYVTSAEAKRSHETWRPWSTMPRWGRDGECRGS